MHVLQRRGRSLCGIILKTEMSGYKLSDNTTKTIYCLQYTDAQGALEVLRKRAVWIHFVTVIVNVRKCKGTLQRVTWCNRSQSECADERTAYHCCCCCWHGGVMVTRATATTQWWYAPASRCSRQETFNFQPSGRRSDWSRRQVDGSQLERAIRYSARHPRRPSRPSGAECISESEWRVSERFGERARSLRHTDPAAPASLWSLNSLNWLMTAELAAHCVTQHRN